MNPIEKCAIGRSVVSVTRMGLGGAGLGDPNAVMSEETANDILRAAYEGGVAYYDTAPWYGCGKSEHRMGHFLRTQPRASFVLSTKVGRVLIRPRSPDTFRHERWAGGLPFDIMFDYTRGGVLRSYEDSLMRLGLNPVDMLLVHDMDFKYHSNEQGVRQKLDELDAGGGWRALEELKSDGEIKAIGFGINRMGMIPRILEGFEPDVFLVAMPYTLLDQDALDEELPLCLARGVAVVIGSVFASGILATGCTDRSVYNYGLPPDAVREAVGRINGLCSRYGVPLPAVALQFPLAHPAVVAVIPGATAPHEVRENLRMMRIQIPASLWEELKAERLIRSDAPTP